jgi:hypothetical protein
MERVQHVELAVGFTGLRLAPLTRQPPSPRHFPPLPPPSFFISLRPATYYLKKITINPSFQPKPHPPRSIVKSPLIHFQRIMSPSIQNNQPQPQAQLQQPMPAHLSNSSQEIISEQPVRRVSLHQTLRFKVD